MKLPIVLVAVAACGGKAAPAPAPVANTPPLAAHDAAIAADSPAYTKLVSELTALSDAMCKCTAKPCAQKVSDEMATWSAANEKNHTSFDNLTPDQQTTVDDLGSRMGDCMQKVK